jgi:CO dehydrogenase maturation factor
MINKTIAITGKGGVGKTTIAAFFVLRMIQNGLKPVLAVDADPNSCLDACLGVKVNKSVGEVREEAREIASKGLAAGISKQNLLEMKISESLVEADDFDLIAMGRPEGPGCYCYANNVLKQVLGTITENYPFVVLDNEAGLENLSRRIVQKVDWMIAIADPSKRGLETVIRLSELAKEMGIEYKKFAVFINRLRKPELPAFADELKNRTNADFIIGLPDNSELADIAETTGDLTNISPENEIIKIIDEFCQANFI